MAILSKIKSAASKVASTVKKAAAVVGLAKSVASIAKSVSPSKASSVPKTASAISSLNLGSSSKTTAGDAVAKITGGTISTKTGGATTPSRVAKSLDVQAIPGSMSRALASMEGRTQKDLAVAAASPATSPYFSQKSSVGGSTSVNSLSRAGAYTAPVASPYTSTRSSVSSSTLSTPSTPLIGATGGSMQGKLPQVPGPTNFTGLSNNYSTLTGVTKIDGTQTDTTGTAQETPEDQRTKALMDVVKQFQPEAPERIDREAIMREAGLTQALKEQQKLANQISAITAQKEAQLLQLRGVASTEGVTEAVYGGQQAQIERETAIKLLPLTAQYEAASGNVQAAKELVANFIADENNYQNRLYQYQQSVYNKVWDYATDQQKTALEEKRRNEDRQYQIEKDFRSEQNKLAELDIDKTGGKNLGRIFGAQNYDELDSVYSTVGASTGGTQQELTTAQTTAVNNLDAVLKSLDDYRQLYAQNVGITGGNIFGTDAGKLAGSYNALLFQIAQAAGTGALQAADREVVESMIPNPTTISGAIGGLVRGGRTGGLNSIDEARKIFVNKKTAITGETPTTQTSGLTTPESLRAKYNY